MAPSTEVVQSRKRKGRGRGGQFKRHPGGDARIRDINVGIASILREFNAQGLKQLTEGGKEVHMHHLNLGR